jgi:hypothetical protein
VPDDLPRAHPTRVHRHDLLVEAGEAPLVLRDQLRVEATLPIPRHLKRNPPRAGDHTLAAVAVAAVSGAAVTRQMVVHLGVQRPLGQRLLQLLQQPALLERSAGIRARQQLVHHLVRYPRRFASGHRGDPLFPS